MPIDASIYSQIRQPVAAEGPLDQYGKMISLKSLMGNEQLNEMQRTKLARDMKEEEDFKALFSGATPDQISAPDFLQRAVGVSPTRGIALQKSVTEQQKAQADLFKTKLETGAKALELHRDQLTNVNDPQAAVQWVKAAYDDPTLRPIAMHGGTLEQAIARIPTDPKAFAEWKRNSSVSAGKLLELNQQLAGQQETGRHNRATENASERANRLAQANLAIKGAEATPGGVFSIPDIVARATGGAGQPAPTAGTMTPAQVLNGAPNALPQAAAAPAAAPQPAQARPAPAQAALPANPVQAAISSGATGEELLKQLPKPMADQVKMMVEGRMAPPTSFAASKPYWQGMLALASQYDPNFDETVWKTRNATRSDFASGANGKNLTAINTAIGHVGSLAKAADALDNSNFPLFNNEVNAVRNFAREKTDPEFIGKVRTFDEAKGAVASELMRVFRGVGASTAETKEWGENIRKSDSPTAMRAAITGATDLLESRIQALSEQYKRGMSMNSDIDVLGMVYPKSRATLDALKAGKVPGKEEKGAQVSAGKITNPVLTKNADGSYNYGAHP